MKSITDAIHALNSFSKQKDVQVILADLADLNQEVTDHKIEVLRKKLTRLLSSEPKSNRVQAKNTFFSYSHHAMYDAVYNTLLILAELKPINEVDPITWNDISPKNKIFTSSGHQFNIITLIAFHNKRISKSNTSNQSLINILINQPFSERDTTHIQDVIKQRVNRLGIMRMHEMNQDMKELKLSLLLGSVLCFIASPIYMITNSHRDRSATLAFLFVSFVLCAASTLISIPRRINEDIEEAPLLNYRAVP